ncbi:sulfite oxidase [Euzebya tangerina]|uniref:sulfite oxidase n=1 Tax=Euzebya tangerina TaxID=591198 RepID=UPI000E32109F|nr:sulfite oxidase [Euzebya tangerina]
MSDLQRTVVDELNEGTPLEALDGRLLDPEQFYVRSHFPTPVGLEAGYRLTISGLVGDPIQLTVDELRQLPQRELNVTLECAGNGRTALDPKAPGTPWGFGAAGVATWAGVSVRDVLDRAAFDPQAMHLLAIGADSGEEDGAVIPYSRSLPLSRALHPDTLLALDMDGRPLTTEHGAPVRLIVPGFYAMASVKWVVELSVRQAEFHGWFHQERYCYLEDSLAGEGAPVTEMRVRSIIASPGEDEDLRAGQATTIRGSAWSAQEGVSAVAVSTDGGRTWIDAELGESQGKYAARGWTCAWTPDQPGTYEVWSRATDGHGRSQPLTQRWNRLGYGNNIVHKRRLTVS